MLTNLWAPLFEENDLLTCARLIILNYMVKCFQSSRRWLGGSQTYWTFNTFLIVVFLTGGGARADIQSLVILRPAAVMFCVISIWTIKWSDVQANKFLFGIAVVVFLLVGAHLIPLPPSIWRALPGREIILEIDKVARLGDVWRPIALVPPAAWNAFFSLFVPLAALLFGVQLTSEERLKLLPILLGLGLFSGFWGLLQAIGDPQGPLYLYQATNNGSAVGLFANRNHQAVMLAMLFPMLAVYACAGVRTEEQAKVRGYIALAAGVVLVPLLLVTGSRMGLILGVLGLASTLLLYRKPASLIPKKRKISKLDLRWLLGAFAVLCLGALTVIMSRAEALQRLSAPDQAEDLRFRAWGPIAEMAWKYFPVGSGIGSFVEVFQIDEPTVLLSPSYLNHAHNDWLEVYLSAGAPGLAVMAIVLFAAGKLSWAVFHKVAGGRADIRHARLGAVMIAIFAVGSLADYPLRVPSLSCVFVIAAIWLARDGTASTKSAGSRWCVRLAPNSS
jgi:O-antigen ligase